MFHPRAGGSGLSKLRETGLVPVWMTHSHPFHKTKSGFPYRLRYLPFRNPGLSL